jgi:hypothetical protein
MLSFRLSVAFPERTLTGSLRALPDSNDTNPTQQHLQYEQYERIQKYEIVIQ